MMILVVVCIATAGVVAWDIHFGWPPVLRSGRYFELLRDFAKAEPIRALRLEHEPPSWDFSVPVENGRAVAVVRGRGSWTS